MAKTSIYLNFSRNTEAAFDFYKSVFGGAFIGDIMRFKDIPPMEGMPLFEEEDKDLVMHMELELPGGVILMGTDAPESGGFKMNFGNNVSICIQPDTKAEAERLFNALADSGRVITELQKMFWGDYYGACADRFGVRWMVDYKQE